MYKLLVRGQDPIFIEDDVKGKMLFDKWTQEEKTIGKVVVNGVAFFGNDIKAIQKIEKTAAENAPKQMTAMETDYDTYREKMLGLTLEQRANIMRIARIIWRAYTKNEMPLDIVAEIKKRQLAYFKENPNCIYANPKIYQDLLPKYRFTRTSDSFSVLNNTLGTSILKIIENVIQTDLQYSVKAK